MGKTKEMGWNRQRKRKNNQQQNQKHGKKLTFNIAYSQQDIADILGVHRTTVARAIRKLKEDDILVRMSRYEIVISDLDGLKKVAHDELPDDD